MRTSNKKRLTCLTVGLSTALCGIEQALILPSACGYLQDRFPGSHAVMLGSLLSSYYLGALVSGPLSCRWSWSCTNTRLLLLSFNLFSLTGAIFYSAAPSPWALVASRLIAGFGFGCQSAMVVDMSRALVGQGTGRRAFFLFHLSRQLGLFLGPAIYLPLESMPVLFTSSTTSLLIDKYSAPGLVLAVAFFLQEFVFFFGYHNLTRLCEEEKLEEAVSYSSYQRFSSTDDVVFSRASNKGQIKRSFSMPHHLWSMVLSPALEAARATAGCRAASQDMLDSVRSIDNESDIAIESAEHFIMSISLSRSLPNYQQKNIYQSEGHASQKSENHSLLHATDRLISESSVCFEPVSRLDRLRAFLQDLSDEYLRDDTVVLLAIIFTSVTCQKLLETLVILFTKAMYTDTERLNCFIFLLIGFQVFLVFVFAQLIRRLVLDRVLLMLGLVMLFLGFLALLLILPKVQAGNVALVPSIVGSGFLCFMAAPLLALCSSSLLINITAFDKQVMTQELSQLLVSLGSILGPLWASAIWGHLYILLGFPLGIVLFIKVLYLMSFRHMIRSSSSHPSEDLTPCSGSTSDEHRAILS